MALLLKSCLLHRTVRCAKNISIIKHDVYSFQHIRKQIESQSLIQAHKFCTTTSLSNDTEPSKDQVLIYKGALNKKMRNVKIFSFATSAGGLLIQPYLIHSAAENSDMVGLLSVSFIFLVFTVANPLLIHMLAKKYVTHIFYDDKNDEYTARTMSFFLKKKETTFQSKDVKPMELTGMFSSCEVNGQSLFIDRENFENPDNYDKMMGFEYHKVFPLNVRGNEAEALNEHIQDAQKLENNTQRVRKGKDD